MGSTAGGSGRPESLKATVEGKQWNGGADSLKFLNEVGSWNGQLKPNR